MIQSQQITQNKTERTCNLHPKSEINILFAKVGKNENLYPFYFCLNNNYSQKTKNIFFILQRFYMNKFGYHFFYYKKTPLLSEINFKIIKLHHL